MKLKWKISLPILILLLLSTLVTTVLNYTMTKSSVDQIVDNIVDSNLNTLISQVDRTAETERMFSEEMDKKNLAMTRALAEIVRLHAEGGTLDLDDYTMFQKIADLLGVDEVHIMDANGVIVGSIADFYYGFDFHNGDQTIPFLRILDDPSYSLAQEPQPNSSYGYLFQYTGTARTDEKGIVQIGIGADMIEKLQNHLDIAHTAEDMRIGSTGRASIIQDNIIVYSQATNKIGQTVDNGGWYKQVSSGQGKTWITIDGESMYAGYANTNGTTLLVLFPRAEYNSYMSHVITGAIIGVAFALLVTIIVYFLVDRLLKPLIPITGIMQKASLTGDFELQPADIENMNKLGNNKDELGALSKAASAFVGRITDISQKLESVADGDLTIEIATLSDRDTLGLSLNKMSDKLNVMFNEIYTSADQVSRGAKQIADGSQTLAQGSTQQAASIEELSSSIIELSQKTKDNAESAGRTAKLAGTIRENAEKGSQQMSEMINAVKDINQSSNNISKVIKVIDDIAFQTNILALNAAVEAARAGQHGKGFAVVAEEVRNLASKSAEAARNTGDMIQDSMAKAELGTRIAGETAASLSEIVSGINESTRSISEIAKSSEEQSFGIAQINKGVDQVAQVVQQNSATAEQSAAASEEMSAQSTLLQELIAHFRLKDSETAFRSLPSKGAPARNRLSIPANDGFEQTGNNSSFGKY